MRDLRLRPRERGIVEAQAAALPGSSTKPSLQVEGAAAEAVGAAPQDRPLPEGERRRTGDDQGRLDAPGRRIAAAALSTRALSPRLKAM